MARSTLMIALAAVALSGCTVSPQDSQDALGAYGFHDAKLGGISPFGCDSKSDGWSRTFIATGPTGARVEGVICKGLLKGSTVRITGRAQ